MRRRLAVLAALVVTTLTTATAALALSGPDVASFQHPQGVSIDWSAVHSTSGAAFAFVKATEGTSYINPYFDQDWSAIAANGMVRGAYHFARPSATAGSAAAQAQYFVNKVGSLVHNGDLGPVLDLEVNGGLGPSALASWTHEWLDTVQQLTGRTPILYTYPYFWQNSMANNNGFGRYPLWLASYSSTPPPPLNGWSHWTFWQYTSDATVSGITGRVDMSQFYGTLSQLQTLANPAAAANPFGTLDSATRQVSMMRVRGWAIDPDTTQSIRAHVYIDGYWAGADTADAYRPDVGAAFSGFGDNHGFDMTLNVPAAGTHKVCLYGINVGAGTTNPLLGCRTITISNNPFGNPEVIERTTDGKAHVRGWVIDPDTTSPDHVHVYVDGAYAGVVQANVSRPDVGAVYPLYGANHGYSATLPLSNGAPHKVCVYAINLAPGVYNPLLGCRTI